VGGFHTYEAVGKELREQCRLTYLFPSEFRDGSWSTWLPEYRTGLGLCWVSESGDASVEHRAFRRSLLWTRAGTAIDPDSDAALDGSLRETECVQCQRRTVNTKRYAELAMAGYVFVQDTDGLAKRLSTVDAIQVGGDSRYGLGRLSRVTMERADRLFGAPADLHTAAPRVAAKRILAHSATSSCMRGAKETLGGWNRTADAWTPHRFDGVLWAPGSVAPDDRETVLWDLRQDGIWVGCDDNPEAGHGET